MRARWLGPGLTTVAIAPLLGGPLACQTNVDNLPIFDRTDSADACPQPGCGIDSPIDSPQIDALAPPPIPPAGSSACAPTGRTCEMVGAACGNPPDGCGGFLTCGGCPDALTTCGAAFACACGRPTALYSPMGDLEAGKRAPSPDLKWFATSAGIFATATAQMVWPLAQVKGFDWHPGQSGQFAQMEHFAPPRAASVITVYRLSTDGRLTLPIAHATGDSFHHYLAWTPDGRLALGGETRCETAATVTPGL